VKWRHGCDALRAVSSEWLSDVGRVMVEEKIRGACSMAYSGTTEEAASKWPGLLMTGGPEWMGERASGCRAGPRRKLFLNF
jgi:hypothetical protein